RVSVTVGVLPVTESVTPLGHGLSSGGLGLPDAGRMGKRFSGAIKLWVLQCQPVVPSTASLPSKRQPVMTVTLPPSTAALPLQPAGPLSLSRSVPRKIWVGGSFGRAAAARAAITATVILIPSNRRRRVNMPRGPFRCELRIGSGFALDPARSSEKV